LTVRSALSADEWSLRSDDHWARRRSGQGSNRRPQQ